MTQSSEVSQEEATGVRRLGPVEALAPREDIAKGRQEINEVSELEQEERENGDSCKGL